MLFSSSPWVHLCEMCFISKTALPCDYTCSYYSVNSIKINECSQFQHRLKEGLSQACFRLSWCIGSWVLQVDRTSSSRGRCGAAVAASVSFLAATVGWRCFPPGTRRDCGGGSGGLALTPTSSTSSAALPRSPRVRTRSPTERRAAQSRGLLSVPTGRETLKPRRGAMLPDDTTTTPRT